MGISVFEDVKVRRAASYAEKKHKGQKYGEEDYFHSHITQVVSSVVNAGADTTHVIVAYLHDVVEDTEATLEDIEKFFGKEVADAVDAITKRPEEPRLDYLVRCMDNPIAKFVKLHDAWCNFNRSVKEEDQRRIRRYNLTIQNLLRGAI